MLLVQNGRKMEYGRKSLHYEFVTKTSNEGGVCDGIFIFFEYQLCGPIGKQPCKKWQQRGKVLGKVGTHFYSSLATLLYSRNWQTYKLCMKVGKYERI